MYRLIFCILILIYPCVAFSQESQPQDANPSQKSRIEQQNTKKPKLTHGQPTPEKTRAQKHINESVESVYKQVSNWSTLFTACNDKIKNEIEIEISYDCKGQVSIASVSADTAETSACIKERIPKSLDIDITKDVCVCKEGSIRLAYSKTNGITIKQKTRIGISKANEYCDTYYFKRSHSKTISLFNRSHSSSTRHHR